MGGGDGRRWMVVLESERFETVENGRRFSEFGLKGS